MVEIASFLFDLNRSSPSHVFTLSFNRTGRLLALCEDKTVCVWDVHTGQLLDSSIKYSSNLTCIDFHPLEDVVAVAAMDGTVMLWSVQDSLDHLTHKHKKAVWALAFSSDGAFLASGGSDTIIKVWNIKEEKESLVLKGHQDIISSLKYNHKGTLLASTSWDRTIRLWNAKDGKQVLAPLKGHSGTVWSVSFSADDSMLVTGSGDQTVRVWRVKDGTEIRTLFGHTAAVNAISCSSTDDIMASASGELSMTLQSGNSIFLWSVLTGKRLFDPILEHSAAIGAVTFCPNQNYMASADTSGRVIVWDLIKRPLRIAIAMSQHHRLGKCSLLALLPRKTLQLIANLSIRPEEDDVIVTKISRPEDREERIDLCLD